MFFYFPLWEEIILQRCVIILENRLFSFVVKFLYTTCIACKSQHSIIIVLKLGTRDCVSGRK